MNKLISKSLLRSSLLVFFISAAASGLVQAQSFFKYEGGELVLDNGLIKRSLKLGEEGISQNRLSLKGEDSYITQSREFSFLLNDNEITGMKGWQAVSVEETGDGHEGKGAKVLLRGTGESSSLELELYFLLYPDLPVIRKWMVFRNSGKEELKIEALNVEDLQTVFSHVQSVILHNYARMEQIGSFVGNWDDPLVVLHEKTSLRGIAIGNEAPGVMKRTAFHTRENNLEAGLSHPGQDYPFRKWLSPGEEWKSPATFIALYSNRRDPYEVVNREISLFISSQMRPRIAETPEKPVFVYNTWYPFRTFVNDSLIREVALAASQCGVQEFIIDDGWQVNSGAASSTLAWGGNYGDWIVDENKFPGGLKPTFDYIKSLGMKPGLWISIAAATGDALVFRQHPGWFVENSSGKPGNLHYTGDDGSFYTSCYGTEWKDYIKETVLRLYREYGLAYAKLDFSVVSSAYVTNREISGCYSESHPYHKDREESFLVIYERLFELFDELHREAPDLFIDCTFETAGKLQLMDYAIAGHAEGNWLSNFEEPSPDGPLRVRHMAWWRSPVLPAGSLVIGNQQFDDPDFDFVLKSLIGTLPIVLGDPRLVPPARRVVIKQWSEWMQTMQEKYDYMSFRQDLTGFGEPREGYWDGWQRFNTINGKGGILAVFRQNAKENKRQVFPGFLSESDEYVIRLAPQGTEILRASGRSLMEKGFTVEVDRNYYGLIFEIENISR